MGNAAVVSQAGGIARIMAAKPSARGYGCGSEILAFTSHSVNS